MVLSKEQIKKIYTTIGHPVAFSNAQTVFTYLKNQSNLTSLTTIKEALAEIDAYTLHVEKKRPRVSNPFFVYERRSQCQLDLFDLAKLSDYNDGIKYILLLIDVFSRKVYLKPLPNKKAISVKNKLNEILSSIKGKMFTYILSDFGSEIHNSQVKALLKEYNIRLDGTYGLHHAAIAERAGKSIQILIFKMLSQNETLRYINSLNKIAETYNNRPHRSLNKYSPNEADLKNNEVKIRAIHNMRYNKIREARKKPIFKKNDIVRVKTLAKKPSSSSRAYAETAHEELFTIEKVHTRLPIPRYSIKSTDTNEIIKGTFLECELVKIINTNDEYKIEKILRKKGKGHKMQYFVKWKNFSNEHNSWIPAKNITQTYE